MTSPGHPYAEFKRALKNGNLWVAEAAARELPRVSLEDARLRVLLYAEKESAKFELAAMRWLERYLAESSPSLPEFAKVVASLAEHGHTDAKRVQCVNPVATWTTEKPSFRGFSLVAGAGFEPATSGL